MAPPTIHTPVTIPDNPSQLTVEKVAQALDSNSGAGLNEKEAERRLARFGPNDLEVRKSKNLVVLFLEQFRSPLAWVLAVAAVLAFVFDEWLEGTAILVVIVINALIGFFMEWQAIRSMAALRKLAQPFSRVYRDGRLRQVESMALVPGDLVFLEAGDIVPADMRIAEANNVEINEAPLTGESLPEKKSVEAIPEEVTMADQVNMLFKGTTVSRGNAKALVVTTGKDTQLGKIAQLTREAAKEATPLEKKLEVLSKKMIWLMLVLALLVLAIGLLQGRELFLMIETAIALAIAAIPEGLPVVATIALARGMLRLARQQVVVKKLSAVETLGETQVIFTDKTGTLTENELLPDTLGFEFGAAEVRFEQGHVHLVRPEDQYLVSSFAFSQLQHVAALCNNATLPGKKDESPTGDPLEIALLKFVEGAGERVQNLRSAYPRLQEMPFDSSTKMMGTLHKNGRRPDYLVCIKGAVEVVLHESDYVLTIDGKTPLTQHQRRAFSNQADALAARGLRVLGFAYSEISVPKEHFFHKLVFIGLIGFTDPLRPEIRAAIAECRQAGIRVIMVTGDHAETARNIGFQAGLTDFQDGLVINGNELKPPDQLSGEERSRILESSIFARVSPAQKLDLVSLYQFNGYTVGMTGDGVNDAPALKKADIGIAMGKRGTEAAKEVADLVLKDDAFTAIVAAIRQGRGIFDNIRHFVVYLLSCNLSELLVVTIAFIGNLPLPLLPLQILFLNMVTDVFPALALGMNKERAQVMNRPPREKQEPILTRRAWIAIVTYAVVLSIPTLGALVFASYYLQLSDALANNMSFYTLILAQLWHLFNLPNRHQSFLKNPVTKNLYVWLALLGSILIVVLVYLSSSLREAIQLVDFSWDLLGWVVLFSLMPVPLIRMLKKMRIIV